MASAVVASLVASGYIPEIKYDFTQWPEAKQWIAVDALFKRALHDCLAQQSVIYTILQTGLQEPYGDLKPPIDVLSYLRPVITVLYLGVAARFFMAAVDRRKAVVFSMVLLAALTATVANILWVRAYLDWNFHNAGCEEKLLERGVDRMAESSLKAFARDLQASPAVKETASYWDVSIRAEGRTLYYAYRLKRPIDEKFHHLVDLHQKDVLKAHCSNDMDFVVGILKATETHTYYGPNGERLTSFSVGPADCSRW